MWLILFVKWWWWCLLVWCGRMLRMYGWWSYRLFRCSSLMKIRFRSCVILSSGVWWVMMLLMSRWNGVMMLLCVCNLFCLLNVVYEWCLVLVIVVVWISGWCVCLWKWKRKMNGVIGRWIYCWNVDVKLK